MQPRRRDWSAQWESGGSGTSGSGRSLGELFKPPSYKFNGTLQEACRKAEQEKKSVVVNIQSVQMFDSHILNRDVWKDAVIEQMVGHNFILCQWDVDDAEGQKYIQFYNCFKFPHLAILDPSIRKEVLVFSDKRSAASVQEVLFGYLEQKPGSTRKRSRPESSQEDINAPQRSSASSNNEEELLQAAIKASLEDYKEEVPPKEDKIENREQNSVEVELPPEPPFSDRTTNLRVQLPDGSKLLRRFNLDSKAQLIFDWCANKCKSRDFKLSTRFPRKVLGEEDYGKTLKDLQFRNMQLFLTKN